MVESVRRPITIVRDSELWAEVSEDPVRLESFADAVTIGPLSLSLPEDPAGFADIWMGIRTQSGHRLAGCFRVRIDTGEGDLIGTDGIISIPPSQADARGKQISMMQLAGIAPGDADRIARCERVDVLLIPDAARAYEDPQLSVISGEGLLYKQLPVEVRKNGILSHNDGHWAPAVRVSPEDLPQDR